MNVDNTEEFRCLSLCTGYAGIELGLKRVVPNLRTVAYVEVEAFAAANLVAKIEESKLDAAPIWTNIKTFNGELFRKRVHIITAGYPCQGESVVGKCLGDKDPRWLWPDIERIIEAVRPVWFFGENVANHLNIGYPTVYRSLRDMGYSVEAGLFTAAECGAPHKRERLFILAHSQRIDDRRTPRQISGENEQQTQERQKRWTTESGSTSQLADTGQPDGHRTEQKCEPKMLGWQKHIISSNQPWPSRPGQPQYEWEEPRVVANTKQRKRRGRAGNRNGGRSISKKENAKISGKRCIEKAQSGVGRAVDGTKCRLDRLKLLGNGVVPQQAEKAFRELIKRFE